MFTISSRVFRFIVPRLVRHVPGLDRMSAGPAAPAACPHLPVRTVSAKERAADGDLSLMAGLRADLYRVEPVPDTPKAQTVGVRRWSAALLNIVLVLVALPMGVALMIHGALRGADLAISGRTMALTGVMLGILQLFKSLNASI